MRHSLTWAALIALSGLCLPFMGLVAMPVLTCSATPQPEWGEDIPEDIRAAALIPDRVLDEKPCSWRDELASIFRPAVRDCKSAREAALTLASRMGELTGVYYDRGRRHPCMNALEALEEKKVSCTGQSILLVCALRSVGIPARAVGVWTWNHVRGNHTWVEAWFEGGWHMVEFNEKDFNTPWVMEAIGMLDPGKEVQRVLAVKAGSGTPASVPFPTVWDTQAGIEAEDVTERYIALARAWYAANGVPADCQKLMVDVQPRSNEPRSIVLEDASGRELGRAVLPTTQDDFRRFATLMLPRTGSTCYLRLPGAGLRHAVTSSPASVQLLRLKDIK